MRGAAFQEFLTKLSAGDPVAVGFVVGFVVLAAVAGLVVWLVGRSLRREEEAWAKKKCKTW